MIGSGNFWKNEITVPLEPKLTKVKSKKSTLLEGKKNYETTDLR